MVVDQRDDDNDDDDCGTNRDDGQTKMVQNQTLTEQPET